MTIYCIPGHCSRYWEQSREQNKNLCPQGAHILVRGGVSKNKGRFVQVPCCTCPGRWAASWLVSAAYAPLFLFASGWSRSGFETQLLEAKEVDGEVSWQRCGSGKFFLSDKWAKQVKVCFPLALFFVTGSDARGYGSHLRAIREAPLRCQPRDLLLLSCWTDPGIIFLKAGYYGK